MRGRTVVGGAALVLTLQYLAAELFAASAWRRGSYGWADDYVSELGSSVCDADGCTPLYGLFSASLVLHGVLLGSAALLLAPLAERRLGRPAAAIVRVAFVAGGVGSLVIGLVPLAPDGDDLVHDVGATLAIVGPAAGGVLLGTLALREPAGVRRWGAVTLAVAALGTVGAFGLVLGAPPGLAERIGVWPFLLWYVGTGASVVTMSLRAASPAGRRG